MDLDGFKNIANAGPDKNMVLMKVTSPDFAPYSPGELAGFPAEEAFRIYNRGGAVPCDENGDESAEAVEASVLDRSVPGPGVAGTTLGTAEYRLPPDAKTADRLLAESQSRSSGFFTTQTPADNPVGVRSDSLPGSDGQLATFSRPAGGNDAANPDVEIPQDWQSLHRLERLRIASEIAGDNVTKVGDAEAIIESELNRRNEAGA